MDLFRSAPLPPIPPACLSSFPPLSSPSLPLSAPQLYQQAANSRMTQFPPLPRNPPSSYPSALPTFSLPPSAPQVYQKVANSRMTQQAGTDGQQREGGQRASFHSPQPTHPSFSSLPSPSATPHLLYLPHAAPFGTGKLVRLGLAGNKEKAGNVFLDFFKTFHFGLWGYQQRPYPAEKPFDIQQVVGTKFLEKRYLDCEFYTRPALFHTPFPLLPPLAAAPAVASEPASAPGHGRNGYAASLSPTLAPFISHFPLSSSCVPPVRLATAGTAILHRIGRGVNPLKVKKGFEGAKRSLEERQAEALADKERERAALLHPRRAITLYPVPFPSSSSSSSSLSSPLFHPSLL
ncbi:unnamed protein product [Closterium sp. NIES-54]